MKKRGFCRVVCQVSQGFSKKEYQRKGSPGGEEERGDVGGDDGPLIKGGQSWGESKVKEVVQASLGLGAESCRRP